MGSDELGAGAGVSAGVGGMYVSGREAVLGGKDVSQPQRLCGVSWCVKQSDVVRLEPTVCSTAPALRALQLALHSPLMRPLPSLDAQDPVRL